MACVVLRTWERLPGFLNVEIQNLRTGLALGYSAPQSVVQRVITQLDSLLAEPLEASSLDSPAQRSADTTFVVAYRKLVAARVLLGIRRYRDFLKDEYLPRARTSVGISYLLNGGTCYAAYLRRYATMPISADEVSRLGTSTVAQSSSEVGRTGKQLFATSVLTEIVRRAHAVKENRFASKEALFEYSRALLQQAQRTSAALFIALPAQPVQIRPLPDYLESSG